MISRAAGIHTDNTVIAHLVNRVLQLSLLGAGCSIVYTSFDFYTKQVDGRVVDPILYVGISVFIPICGILAAKQNSSGLACCFCSCSLFQAVRSCVFIHHIWVWFIIVRYSSHLIETYEGGCSITTQDAQYFCGYVHRHACGSHNSTGEECCSCLSSQSPPIQPRKELIGCPLESTNTQRTCQLYPGCEHIAALRRTELKPTACCDCITKAGGDPYQELAKMQSQLDVKLKVLAVLMIPNILLQALVFYWGNTLWAKIKTGVIINEVPGVTLSAAGIQPSLA